MAPVTLASIDQKLAMAKRCSHEGVVAGAKAAAVAGVAAAVPTVSTKQHFNTLRSMLADAAAGLAYFVVADKTVLAQARKNSFKDA
ncbi:hypothetical protein ZIOFF_067812 [Zingiber officinale]|uniref:Early nodulin-93-like n=1 Tax=Zingiber officinale TaxID=94328 RepID=A0A8J5CG34_ZINOF|nr:hypothetical protein ZIOFF_067812 [Zingiber officinale]